MKSKEPVNEKDVFTDDKDFFKALKSSMENSKSDLCDNLFETAAKTKSLNLIRFQLLLLILMAVVTVPLLYIAITQSLKRKVNQHKPNDSKEIVQQANNIIKSAENDSIQQPIVINTQIEAKDPEPVSLLTANQSFSSEKYAEAFTDYEKIYKALLTSNTNPFIQDFIELRMALCLEKLGHTDPAYRLLRKVSKSQSTPLAAVASYNRAVIEFRRKIFLQARMFAYQAVSLCQAVTADINWASNLERNCELLIALSLSRKALILTDSDHDTPQGLWNVNSIFDPCNDMDEEELLVFLKTGTDKINKAVIGPKAKRIEFGDKINRFEIISKLSPLEELMARFAANADIKLIWNLSNNSEELLNKPVTLYMHNVSIEEFVTVACGCAGLKPVIYEENNKTTVAIENLSQYTELQNHINSLSRVALDRWNTFIIKYHNDPELDKAYYAMGMLYHINSKTNEAITQFKLLSNRFGYSPLAKYALLQSSKIKSDMHDYSGASQDLKRLIEQHHQSEIAQQACLYLADSSYKAQLYQQAAANYQKVYNFDVSIESKSNAALGTAKSYYMNQDYLLAENWLKRFINMSENQNSTQIQYAYMLLGKTNLKAEKPEQAFEAFKMAISNDISKKDRSEIISALLESDFENLDTVQALDVIRKLQKKVLSNEESIKLLLVRSRLLRKIYLPQKALISLKERIEYITDADLRAQVHIEMAKILANLKHNDIAENYLTKALELAEPPLNYDIKIQLAQIALQLGENKKAIEYCSGLIEKNISKKQRGQAAEIMATAYHNKQNFEKALSSLLEVKEKEDHEQNTVFEQDDSDQSSINQQNLQES